MGSFDSQSFQSKAPLILSTLHRTR